MSLILLPASFNVPVLVLPRQTLLKIHLQKPFNGLLIPITLALPKLVFKVFLELPAQKHLLLLRLSIPL